MSHDLHTPTPEAAAAHANHHAHPVPRNDRARATEAGVTAADIPPPGTHDCPDDCWACAAFREAARIAGAS